MGIAPGKIRNRCSIAPLLLCGWMQAQVVAAPPLPEAATPSLSDLHIAQLPDSTAPLTSSTMSASQSLHLRVGQSIFISTVSRLKRVYVSDPLVVDSFTSSPRQIVVTGKSPGVSSLILWDEAGNSSSYWVSSDLNVASLQDEIREALPNENINVDAQQDRIALSGTVLSDASAEVAVKLAGLYAKNVVNSVTVRQPHARQVKLKVQIIEIDRSKLEQFGINIFSEGKNLSNSTTGQFPSTPTYTPPSGTAPATLTTTNPLNLLFYNFGVNVGLTVQDLHRSWPSPRLLRSADKKPRFLLEASFPFRWSKVRPAGLHRSPFNFGHME
jgi:pilus assembly protein CpaC